MGHLNEFILDVARSSTAVVLGRQGGSADEHIAHTDLTAAITLPVIASESFHDHASKLSLSIQKNAVVGNKYVVKNGHRFHSAKLSVAHVQLGTLQLPGVAALPTYDHVDTFCVHWYGKGHGVVLVLGAHGDGGHDNDLMGVEDTGLVQLGSPNHYAISSALHNVKE